MTKIYDQHAAAFRSVSAFVILKDGERVATVALKFPADGAGRLYAYVHWIGAEMVRGFAGGYGYDKRSAAVAEAIGKFADAEGGKECFDMTGAQLDACAAFMAARHDMDAGDWTRALEKAGFQAIQAV